MSHSPLTGRSKADSRLLTVREVIKYLKEQAEYLGEIGFTTHFPDPNVIFGQPVDLNAPGEFVDYKDNSELEAAVNNIHNKLIWLQTHKKQLEDCINQPVIAEAEKEVDAQLLAGGKPKRFLSTSTLGAKVVALIEQQNPKETPNSVKVLLYIPAVGSPRTDLVPCYLPLPYKNIRLYEILELLDSAAKVKLARTQGGGLDPGVWKYQLMNKKTHKVVNKASTNLETGADYVEMLKAVADKDALVAVLNQTSLTAATSPVGKEKKGAKANSSTSAAVGTDGKEREGGEFEEVADDDIGALDDDGNPFFDQSRKVDLPAVLERFAARGFKTDYDEDL